MPRIVFVALLPVKTPPGYILGGNIGCFTPMTFNVDKYRPRIKHDHRHARPSRSHTTYAQEW